MPVGWIGKLRADRSPSRRATPTTYPIPAPDGALFLGDSTLVWRDGSTIYAEPVLGGPVTTIATSNGNYMPIGGSQIATGSPSGTSIVDATGKVPSFVLDPAPNGQGLVAPPAGGIVAYVSGGAIYAVKTKS
jgi:hypothetical protein